MNYLSLSRSPVHYESSVWLRSKTHPGVRFAVGRMSFGRRLEIATEIARLGQQLEFLKAGVDVREKAEARAAEAEIERTYLRCGLACLDGLEIDGTPASADLLFESGPEDLTREILAAIQAEWGLSQDERKN